LKNSLIRLFVLIPNRKNREIKYLFSALRIVKTSICFYWQNYFHRKTFSNWKPLQF